MILDIPVCYSMCDLIKLGLWMRGSMQPPSHVELVETSRGRVLSLGPIHNRVCLGVTSTRRHIFRTHVNEQYSTWYNVYSTSHHRNTVSSLSFLRSHTFWYVQTCTQTKYLEKIQKWHIRDSFEALIIRNKAAPMSLSRAIEEVNYGLRF